MRMTFQDYRSHNELLALRRQVEDFKSGEVYKKLEKQYETKLTEKLRQIDRCEKRIETLEKDCQLLKSANKDLKSGLFVSQGNVSRLESLLEEKEDRIKELETILEDRDIQIQRMKALLNTDPYNSGLPSSKTPFDKEKPRPNSRIKSPRKIGGQEGHKKHILKPFDEKKITDHIIHEYEGVCPSCSGILQKTDETIDKDEYEIETIVHKIRHSFNVYECSCCKRKIHKKIPVSLKEKNQYGAGIQALSLSLMNCSNAAINKVSSFLYGISDNEIRLSQGYIAKLQHKAAEKLSVFRKDLKDLLISQPIIYWDDTVISIDTKRACLRFYGNERIAWYAAHEHKDLESILDDDILKQLSEDTYVMHDHNSINYNEAFRFKNIECNIHLERDLQKIIEILHHEWASDLRQLIQDHIHERKLLKEKDISSFDEEKLASFDKAVNLILEKALKENDADFNKYYGKEEKALIRRLYRYKDNYFMWVKDFSLPYDDNLSERSLRCIKSKLKISGQFKSEKSADDFALIKSYIETSKKNGINEILALKRLAEGDPYTVREIFNINEG